MWEQNPTRKAGNQIQIIQETENKNKIQVSQQSQAAQLTTPHLQILAAIRNKIHEYDTTFTARSSIWGISSSRNAARKDKNTWETKQQKQKNGKEYVKKISKTWTYTHIKNGNVK